MVSAESVISQSGAENARNRRIFLVEMISRICYNGIRQAGETAKERKYSYGRIFDIYQGKAHQPGGRSGHRRDPSQSPPAPERVRHCGHPVPGRQHSPERHFTAADGAAWRGPVRTHRRRTAAACGKAGRAASRPLHHPGHQLPELGDYGAGREHPAAGLVLFRRA